MDVTIRPVHEADCPAVVRLSLRAWEPVFQSFRDVLGPVIYAKIWPEWEVSQAEAVALLCRGDGQTIVWVAETEGTIIGFISYVLNAGTKTGEVTYLAVDPAYQNRGVGAELNLLALAKMRAAGMELAQLETGGDPGHAAARRSYERAGYTGLPCVRYFQLL